MKKRARNIPWMWWTLEGDAIFANLTRRKKTKIIRAVSEYARKLTRQEARVRKKKK